MIRYDLNVVSGPPAVLPKINASSDRRAGRFPPSVRGEQRLGRYLILLVALLALHWQSFVAQTHVHSVPGTYYAAIVGKVDAKPQLQIDRSSSDPASCPICQAIAHAGHLLLPAPLGFQVLQSTTSWIVVTSALALTLHQRSHSWRSRAPPHPLQT